jgi:ribosomal protein S10
MDVLPRVKPKQNYEWFQDQKTVRVRLQIKGTSSKKIDIFISDLILKVYYNKISYQGECSRKKFRENFRLVTRDRFLNEGKQCCIFQ